MIILGPLHDLPGPVTTGLLCPMLVVAIAGFDVAGLAAIAEALSPQGTLLGAPATFIFCGALPLALVLYLPATPARRKALRCAESAAVAETSAERLEPDRCTHAPAGRSGVAGAVAPEREEP